MGEYAASCTEVDGSKKKPGQLEDVTDLNEATKGCPLGYIAVVSCLEEEQPRAERKTVRVFHKVWVTFGPMGTQVTPGGVA